MALALPIEFLADVQPLDALDRFVGLATPVLSVFGWALEARGSSWAHWTQGGVVGSPTVIRAYAFDTTTDRGVAISVTGPNEIPAALPQHLCDRVVEATAWSLKQP
jgi:hypothetical protein